MDLPAVCTPGVEPSTLAAVVRVESAGNPLAIGINGGARLSRQPATVAEAVEVADRLLAAGRSADFGLAQINAANVRRFGLTTRELFDPCANLRAASRILADCYRRARAAGAPHGQVALAGALSCFNTGDLARGRRYAARVYAAAATLP